MSGIELIALQSEDFNHNIQKQRMAVESEGTCLISSRIFQYCNLSLSEFESFLVDDNSRTGFLFLDVL